MLDVETRRRIDTARDILVGKVPDPKSQVEQITIALIYKFMDDIDAESEELGGRRTFFAGEFARYGWAKLMRSGLGGHETLNLYAEAITRMPENPGIPQLFRAIFDNAYLPYRDPETLRAFLKVIDEFVYDHSERLGDAFEYLLSVLGSQGDAGQFRTPRHIIDFMVSIADPKKDEVVLDPACGTAGFLISSYKHILKANEDGRDGAGSEPGQSETSARHGTLPASGLTPEEKGRLAENFSGYDISPDMVRLSLVNLYLHGFVDPHIHEYDTLTSEDRWNEYADVILANPPFMSPKGGIRPHNRFSVMSKRSEVLFVDYMAEHLNPSGRAGIIVPEGIIFQSQTAHRRLRTMLVEEYLVAVVSLPAGVFQPYSGVKTSILILDKALAKRTDRIAFFKVENDGFDLGAQRRPIDKNDLPEIAEGLREYLAAARAGVSWDARDDGAEVGSAPPADHPLRRVAEEASEYRSGGRAGRTMDRLIELGAALVVAKDDIAANGDYNLSGERYRKNGRRDSQFPILALGELAEIIAGQSPPGTSYNDAGMGTPFYQGKTEFREIFIGEPRKWTTEPQRFAENGDILMSVRAPVGPVNLATQRICIGRGLAAIRLNSDRYLALFAFHVLRNMESEIIGSAGAAFASITKADIAKTEIPLPPLDVQKEIVAEIEGYQKVIDGARAVVDNYRPHIAIDPDWPEVELGTVCAVNSDTVSPKDLYGDSYFNYIDISCIENATGHFIGANRIEVSDSPSRARRGVAPYDVLVSTVRPNLRAFAILTAIPDRAVASTGFAVLRPKVKDLLPNFLIHMIRHDNSVDQMIRMMGKGSYPSINQADVKSIRIPLPSLNVQEKIVTEIDGEQALIGANGELIRRFEKKIQATIAQVWGDGEPAPGQVRS